MSDELYSVFAANPTWFDAEYGYEDNVAVHNALGFDDNSKFPAYDTASCRVPDGAQQSFDQAATQGGGLGLSMVNMISPFHVATAEDQLRNLRSGYDGSLGFEFNESSSSSAVSSGPQDSLMQENFGYTDAEASAIERFHVRPSKNSLTSPNAIQNVTSSLVATHSSSPTDSGRLDSEGGLHIIPYDPEAAVPKGQKRKRAVDDELAVTRRNVRRDTTTGRILGEFSTMGNVRKKKVPLDDKRRKETAIARRLGVCARCKKLKKGCNLSRVESPYEPCQSCRDAKPYHLRTLCLRDKITVASFFRLRPAFQSPLETTSRKQIFEVSEVSGPLVPSRTLRLTQDIGLDLVVQVAKFIRVDGDKTAYEWTDDFGNQREMQMPLYCLTNLDNAKENMLFYALNSRDLFLHKLLAKPNDITWDTIRMALRFATSNKTSIVRFALDLWSYCRIIEQTWRICGPDTLGLETIRDSSNRWNGMIPVTPIMDTQLDQIVIRGILLPLSKVLLGQLQYTIEKHNRPDTWFEIYLTCFILMTTTESVAIHSRNFARQYGIPRRYASYEQMEELFHGANIVLTCFHYACNGAAPLQIDWTKEESAKIAKLDAEEVNYMLRAQAEFRKREIELRALHLKHKYDTHLYWAHQLWFPNWKATVAHIENEIP